MTHVVVTCARSWLGTRFHHQGRLKKTAAHKGGVDCLGLLVGVAAELNLRNTDGKALAWEDETDYSHRPDTAYLQKKLSALLKSIPVWGIEPGDIVLLRIDDHPQHLAIISDMDDRFGVIHAYAPARAVVEHNLDDWWKERIQAAFRVS